MESGIFNLEKAVQELLDAGLQPNAKDVTVFVNLDGFRILHLPNQVIRVCVGKDTYPLVVEPTTDIHHSGDVRLKYNSSN